MDDQEVADFWGKGTAGTLSRPCRWLIGTTTVATIVVAYLAWHRIWDLYGCAYRVDKFWVRNGVWVGIAAASLAAFALPSRVSRFIRLATLLPLIHLAAVIASVVLWLPFEEHARELHYRNEMIAMPLHPVASIAIGSVVLVGCAWLIQRREPLQAMLVLALSFLLLLGAWLPYCAAGWFHHTDRLLEITLLAPRAFLKDVLLPPLLAALAFTTLAMRWPTIAKRNRGWTITIVSFLLVIAAGTQLAPKQDAVVLYLNAAQLLLMAQGLAIATLVVVVIATWLGARRARARLRATRSERGTIADPDCDQEAVVELQLDGWLRAPRIETYPFEIVTASDRVPVGGAPVLWSVPAATTRLAIGERCTVLRRGDVITIHRRDQAADGHPFRAMSHADVVAIAASDAGTSFANMTLMLWRPATAYMAIALAVMVPAALALFAS